MAAAATTRKSSAWVFQRRLRQARQYQFHTSRRCDAYSTLKLIQDLRLKAHHFPRSLCTNAENANVVVRPSVIPDSAALAALLAKQAAMFQPSRGPNDRGRALAPHFRLFELRGGNGAVERGAQRLGGLQRQLDPGARAGLE